MKQLRRYLSFILALMVIWGTWGAAFPSGVAKAATTGDLSDPATFIKGADISTLQAIEDNGGKYYENGVEKDALDILKDHGVNYIRVRVWNNPTLSDGYNDTSHLLSLAERVKSKGLKLLVDFHYSDFWADPGQQNKPAAWENLSFDQLKQAVYDYTVNVLNSLKSVDTDNSGNPVNAYPDMVQIGNEINSGMLLPDGSSSTPAQLAQLLASGIKAVRDTTPSGQSTKIMLHLANGGNNSAFVNFFTNINSEFAAMRASGNDIDYDVIGLSYYPYWHGTFKQLKDNMNDLATRFGKELVVAETAYPSTLADGDGWPNTAGQNEVNTVGFPATPDGQNTVIQTVMNTVANVTGGKGLGVFYWEPGWIPVPKVNGEYRAGWKTGEGNAWDNQAMFDAAGNALPSLDVFKFLPGDLPVKEALKAMSPAPISMVVNGTPELPAAVDVLYNDGDIQSAAVTWDVVDPTSVSQTGTFTLHGTVNGTSLPAAIDIHVLSYLNLVKNSGFEDSDTLSDWTVTGATYAVKLDGSQGNAHTGTKSVNYWHDSDYSFQVTQTFTGLKNGAKYVLKAWASGGTAPDNKLQLFADPSGGTKLTVDAVNTGWAQWHQYEIRDIIPVDGTVTIGFDLAGKANTWGNLDDIEFYEDLGGTDSSNSGGSAGGDAGSTVNLLNNPGFENGDTLSDWTVTGSTYAIKLDSNQANAHTGTKAANYWLDTDYAFTIHQTIIGLHSGSKYVLKAWASGGGGDTKLQLFADPAGGTKHTVDAVNTGWNDWHQYTIDNIVPVNGEVTIGFDLAGKANTWGYLDDFEFYEVGPALPQWGADKQLSAVSVTSTGLHLSWSGVADPGQVREYRVYQDGQEKATVSGNVYGSDITGLSPNTTYTFKVEASSDLTAWTSTGPSVTVTTLSSGSGGSANDGNTGSDTNGNTGGNTGSSNQSQSTPGTTVVTSAMLTQQENGKAVVNLAADAKEISLPANTAELLAQGSLVLKHENLSLELPTDVFANLISQLPESARSSSTIVLKLAALPAEAAKALVEKAGSAAHAGVTAAGEVYEFELTAASGDQRVTVHDLAAPVTLHLKASSPLHPELTGIYYIADDGKLEYVGGTYANGEMTATIHHFSKYAVLEVNKSFTDVPADHWSSSVIKQLAARQLVNGTSDTAFEPDRTVTRAEFTMMLTNALKLSAKADSPFADVTKDAWYASSVAATYEAGIVNGRSETAFDPYGQITREEMAVMIMRAYEQKYGSKPAPGFSVPFVDMDQVSSWAASSIQAAAEMKLIQGRGAGQFVPQGTATRAEAAQIIYQLLKL